MSDNKRIIPHQGVRVPVVSAASVPAIPSSSGALAFSRTGLAKKDAAFSTAFAEKLRAQADAHAAARELSNSRFDLAVALNKWNSLGEVCQHEYQKGYLSRHSELKVLALDLETKEINARIARDAAMIALSAYQPQPPEPPCPPVQAPPAPAPVGLSPSEIEEVVRAGLPEVTPDTLRTLSLLLQGRLAEKKA